jgi:O-antigen/teichoic acid export membrane protein
MDSATTKDAVPVENAQGLVFRNTTLLVVAQVVATPVSVLINAMMARFLGPADFGLLYVAWTFATFAGLAAECGQGGALPAMVAKNRARAGEFLGSVLVWRTGAWAVSCAALAVVCWILHYPMDFQMTLAFVMLNSAVASFGTAGQDTIRGFERTDVAAYSNVGGLFLTALLVIPTLFLGGRIRGVLLAQTAASALVGLFVWRNLRPAGVGRLSFRFDAVKTLLSHGYAFLFFGLALALQPNIDAIFLTKLAPIQTIGWYSAARKLIGVLIFPASALTTAIYPTLCRLHAEDQEGFRKMARSGLRMTTILVVPVAVGCFFYADLGIRLFSRASFGPAGDDLRMLAAFVFLVYFSMALGIALLAAGRQRAWAIVQCLCVVVSVVLDPPLIRWFQTRMQNGGLGVCVTTVASEVLMVGCGIALAPRGLFDRALIRQLALALLAGGAMALVAWLLSGISPFLSAPVAVTVYGVGLVTIGGLDKEQLDGFRSIVARKFKKRAA